MEKVEKIDYKESRQKIENQLKETIKQDGFESAREKLDIIKKEWGGEYKKAQKEKITQWFVQKFLSDPDFLSNLNSSEISYGNFNEFIKKYIENEKIKPTSEISYKIFREFNEKKFENDPNMKAFISPFADMILDRKGENKYIILNISGPINIEEEKDLSWYYNKLFNYTKESDLENFSQMMNYIATISTITIARPKRFPFENHSNISSFFNDKNKLEITDDHNYYESEIIKKEKQKAKEEIKDFFNQAVEIYKKHQDENEFIEKVKELGFPKVFHNVLGEVLGGGFVDLVEKNDKVGLRFYGHSQDFGQPSLKEIRSACLGLIKSPNKVVDFCDVNWNEYT